MCTLVQVNLEPHYWTLVTNSSYSWNRFTTKISQCEDILQPFCGHMLWQQKLHAVFGPIAVRRILEKISKRTNLVCEATLYMLY